MRPTKEESSSTSAPFVMLEHQASKVNNNRMNQLLNALRTKKLDGLNNVERLTQIKQIKSYPTFTHLLINVNQNY